MYRYDELDQALVDQRVVEYRDQVRRRLTGALSEEEFRPLRLMNGLYLQLHAYMLRVAIPYGTLSAEQMRVLAHIARTWDRGYGHFTTRQNIQYNWIGLEDTPDILEALARVEMHAIQTSGNCIRNVTADHLAGAAPGEVDDPRVWAEIIRQWSMLHPEFSFLPRKFKIAVTGSPADRAAVRVHDIGVIVRRGANGERGFEIVAGGGLGRTPMIAPTVLPFVGEAHLLSALEAILRVYNRHGRRDNKYKARIKILVHELGLETFTREVGEEWDRIRDTAVDLPPGEAARIRQHFAPPPFARTAGRSTTLDRRRLSDPAFAAWCRSNVGPHRQPGHAIAHISLKPEGGIPGDITAEQMDVVADLAERYGFSEIRASHEQNLLLPHVRQDDLFDIWQALEATGLGTPNIGLVSDIIACPGLDYCSLANARSIPVAQALSRRFADLRRQHDIGDLRIKISGCINACGHHHVGHIGLLGVDRRGEEYYQITLGGNAGPDAAIGRIIGPAVPADQVVDAVETVVEAWLGLRGEGETFPETWRRLGADPFREALYATA